MKQTATIPFLRHLSFDFNYPRFFFALIASVRSKLENFREHVLSSPNPDLNETIKRLNQTIEELSQQNSLKDRLLAIVSHDMRSPLDSLKGLISLVINRNIKKAELKEAVANLDRQVDQLSHFLDNMLRWVKNNSFEIKPRFELIALHDLVLETIELHRPQAKQKQVFIYENIGKDVVVSADAEMTKLILRNLITNAIKFCRANDSIFIGTTIHDNYVTISVQDTGQGIASEDIPKLFSISHLSSRGTKNEIGIGIGLTLCKEFVEKMGGKIMIESTKGKGSRFEFSVHSPMSPTAALKRFIESHEKSVRIK